MSRLRAGGAGLLTLAVLAVLVPGSPALAYPPTPPDEATSRSHLAALSVRAEGSTASYDRSLFPHWSTVSGTCDTRDEVLKRDGTGVTVDSMCEPTSGSWYSVYDAVWVTDDSSVDIDHIVALAEAWRSGASTWTTTRRQQFANDLTISQLIAVSASSNRSKGDQDPSEWIPTNQNVHCIYAREWIHVKWWYGLSVDSPEKAALDSLLDSC